MSRSIRLDYDKIAHLYDSQPYRAKSPDPELSAFIREHPARGPISVLDIACGTGNQLIANRAVAPEAWLVGADASFGMLRQGCAKAPDIAWIRADATALPLSSRTFDFVGCQFAFHHFQDKRRMLAEGFRLLRPGGRLVLHNMGPEECPDWIYYRYFPAARGADARDFWPVAKVTTAMTQVGFVAVQVQYEHVRSERDLSHWLRAFVAVTSARNCKRSRMRSTRQGSSGWRRSSPTLPSRAPARIISASLRSARIRAR